MKKLYLIVGLLLVVALVLGSFGCAKPAATPTPTPKPTPTLTPTKPPWPEHISLATGRMGGSTYVLGTGMAALINKYVPGVKATAEATAGFQESMLLVAQKKVEICATADEYNWSFTRGLYPEIWKEPVRWQVLLNSDFSTFVYIFTLADSPIKTVPDLRGKRFAANTTGIAYTLLRQGILKAYGMTDNDVKLLTYTDFNEAVRLVKEGVADAGFGTTAMPFPALTDLANVKPVSFVPLEDDKAKAVNAELKFYLPYVLPAGTYKGQDKGVPGLAGGMSWNTYPELDADLVYAIMKAVWDHEAEYNAIHAVFPKQWSLQTALRAWLAPYHPGAIRYYKEKGLWTKEMDDKQAQLLKEVKQ